jgi:hypothetical protein
MNRILPCLMIILMVCVAHSNAYPQKNDTAWQKIKPFFSPPKEYAGKFGDFRSPLKFYDGRTVKTAADWQLRRKEILNRWQDMLGHWPELIDNPWYEITDSSHKENFTIYTIHYTWRANEKAKGYLLVPDEKGIKPAVVTVFYEPETALGYNKPQRDFALQLARRGFVVLSTGADPFPNKELLSQYYPNADSVTVEPLSMLGYLAANAYNLLAKLPYVDSNRIGVTGHSYGGKWAMFASCLYEKFACAVWSDLGVVFDESRPDVNYYHPWYLGFYPQPWPKEWPKPEESTKGAYPKLRKAGMDLHELHALMAPRPFLVSGGSEDRPNRWIALNHAVAVNKVLGYKNRVALTSRPEHQPTPESNEQLCLFFEHFLKNNGITKKE